MGGDGYKLDRAVTRLVVVAVAILLGAGLKAGAAGVAEGGEFVPFARVMIYAGEIVTEAMLEDRRASVRAGAPALPHISREQVVGRVARRSFLPGQPMSLAGLREPEVVHSGKPVTLIFRSGDLVITARGLAVQGGAVGEVVSVQNAESGSIIRGVAQSDGTVRLED